MRNHLTDFNHNLIINELNNIAINKKDSFIQIKRELRNQNTNRFNYQGYSLKNSDQFLVDVLCSSCFNKKEQLQLIKLYIDYTNSLQSINKINLDDLFLSCIEASTVKCSDLLLEECLKNSLNEKNLNEITVLDVMLNTFAIKLYPIIMQKTIQVNDMHKIINEYELFILKLIHSGFRLSFKTMSYDKCLLVLMFVNIKDLLICNDSLNEFKNYLNKSLNNLIDCVNEKRINLDLIKNKDNLKLILYNQIKKSTFDAIINKETNEKLKNLVLSDSNKFNPLKLGELCRKKIKSISPNYSKFDLLPDKLQRYLNYVDEMTNNFLFYFYFFK